MEVGYEGLGDARGCDRAVDIDPGRFFIDSNQTNLEVMTMMQGDWMENWGNGYMGGAGGLLMILVVILVIVGIVAFIRKK